MQEIQLTQDKVALVDDDVFEQLNQFNWHLVSSSSKGLYYASTELLQQDKSIYTCFMHWAVVGFKPPKGYVINHMDYNGLNNQGNNLRLVTHRQNTQHKRKEYSSKYPGVSWHKLTKKWIAHIKIDSKVKHLGSFDIEEEAFEKYKWACSICGQEVINIK